MLCHPGNVSLVILVFFHTLAPRILYFGRASCIDIKKVSKSFFISMASCRYCCCCCCWRQDGITWTKIHVRTPEQPLGLKSRLIDGVPPSHPPPPNTRIRFTAVARTSESSARVFQDPLRNEG